MHETTSWMSRSCKGCLSQDHASWARTASRSDVQERESERVETILIVYRNANSHHSTAASDGKCWITICNLMATSQSEFWSGQGRVGSTQLRLYIYIRSWSHRRVQLCLDVWNVARCDARSTHTRHTRQPASLVE